MTMLNQAAVEALCSATYLENYLDTMENLPDDLQRVVTQMRELDIVCRGILEDIDYHHSVYLKEAEGMAKKKALINIQRALIKCQEIGDEKLSLMSTITEHIENRQRQLEQDRENLDPTSATKEIEKDEIVPVSVTTTTKAANKQPSEEKLDKVPIKRQRRQKASTDTLHKEEEKKEEKGPKKKKKRKAKKDPQPASPLDTPIDPDEPTYCLCDQVSYGEMIGCDNDACVIEWFHFNCVGLVNKPKGKWFCPNCRGESCKVMRKFDK